MQLTEPLHAAVAASEELATIVRQNLAAAMDQ
jgi:hypothetical protein